MSAVAEELNLAELNAAFETTDPERSSRGPLRSSLATW